MVLKAHRMELTAAILCVLLGITGVSAAAAADFEERLTEAVLQAVADYTGYSHDQLEITLHERRFPPQCESATDIRITMPSHDDGIGPVTVRAEFSDAAGVFLSLPVPMRVKVFDDVLVTRHRLARHHVIAPADVMLERREITQMARSVMRDTAAIADHWASRTINKGRILDSRWVVPVPLVRKGDRVTMVYASGAVSVSTTAVAMEDGYRDQTIAIKRPKGRKLLTAVVTDEGIVRPAD